MPQQNQTTLIGISTNRDLVANELGSNELHRRHTVRLESDDGVFLRAKVVDQLLVDRLYLQKAIDVDQYDAAMAFYGLAHRSGIFPSSIQMERVQMSVGNRAPRALAILSADRYLQRNCPPSGYRAVWNSVIRELPSPMVELRTGLNTLKIYFNPTLTPGSRRSVRSTTELAETALQAACLRPLAR